MSIRTIDPTTLKTWLDTHQALLVDVREPAEYESEHIEGATPLPLGKVDRANLPKLTGHKLVIHCRKGGRGQSACEKLRLQLPEVEVYNLAGGIEAWSAAGFPVVRSGRNALPLDRQVQLTIGLLLLAGSLFGAVYGAGFFLMTGFIGAGLTFAGLTGFCGLARVIARMPWNQ